MKTDKIIEILAEILNGLNHNYSIDKLNKVISNKKYDDRIVGAAFALAYDNLLNNKLLDNNKKEYKRKSFRFFTEEEKDILGEKNCNYLLKLVNKGLLSNTKLDELLNKLMLAPDIELTQEDINVIIIVSFVEYNSNIIPDERSKILYINETIN